MSPATVPHMETVFSLVRTIYEREPADPMEDLDVNAAIWDIFLNTTLPAAVAFHLGQDYEVNLRIVRNLLWKSVEQLFNEITRPEILGPKNTRNHWYEDDCFQRTYVENDKLIVQHNLSDHQCQHLHLVRLIALCGRDGR